MPLLPILLGRLVVLAVISGLDGAVQSTEPLTFSAMG